jgi:MYXO-CTERM domain-containing protein
MFNTGSGAYVKGKFTNSVFHDNVMVDSGWISLLQVNNTKLINVRWENNTIVHHDMGTTLAADGTTTINLNDFGSSGIQAIAFNSTSSGVTGGGEISAGDIYWTNNLWYFDTKVKPYNLIDVTHRGSDALLANITVTGDIVVTSDPGFKDITSKSDPTAYDLVAGSIAIDKGVTDTSITQFVTTDFLGRLRPAGAAYDLGAFEYGASSAGGAAGSGGATTSVTGKGGAGGTTTNVPGTGGTSATSTSVPAGSGGASGPGGRPGGGGVTGAGGSTPTTTATLPKGTGGGTATTSAPAGSGGATEGGSGGVSGSGGNPSGTTVSNGNGKSGCSCTLGQGASRSPMWLGLIGFAWLALRAANDKRSRRRHRCRSQSQTGP